MKCKYFLPIIFLLVCFASCKNSDTPAGGKPENDIDAARDFIRSTLDGKFDQAKKYMYPDSVNYHYLAVAERIYDHINPEIKNDYRGSSINIHGVTPINDSTTIIIYSNSYKNDHDTLRAMKVKGDWLIDLKYLYEHDIDTSKYMKQKKDTLP